MAGKRRNLVVVSDTHCGCQLGLCPPTSRLDSGGSYNASDPQSVLWSWWQEFWTRWVPSVIGNEPFDVVCNGDIIDGRHHGSTTQIAQNLSDQCKIAKQVWSLPLTFAQRFYMVRGTEAHVGKSGEDEERLAEELGAVPDELGNHARYDLWIRVGGQLVHLLHHIGTTGSNAYEATAIQKELVEEFNEAARWGEEPPACIVRSHRHRAITIRTPTKDGEGIAVVTPGWQLKTPFAWKVAGARLAPPQIGGIIIRVGDSGEIYVRHWTRHISRSRIENDPVQRVARAAADGDPKRRPGNPKRNPVRTVGNDGDPRAKHPAKARRRKPDPHGSDGDSTS